MSTTADIYHEGAKDTKRLIFNESFVVKNLLKKTRKHKRALQSAAPRGKPLSGFLR